MKSLTSLFSLLLFIQFQANACLNGDSKELKNGNILYADHDSKIPTGHNFFLPEDLKPLLHEMDSLYKATKDLDYLSDKGLILILSKEYDQAIDLYLKLEKLEPNRYSTASNIGTAYELIGDNENALKWIRRSVEIDPKSHHSSEWLHVKILEAKLKGSSAINTQFLIDTDFGNDSVPKTFLQKKELDTLTDVLYYQLHERMSFIKPKEKIVAQLLFDMGNIFFLRGEYWDAILTYKVAKEYGYDNKIITIRETAAYLHTYVKRPAILLSNSRNGWYIGIGISLVFLIAIAVIVIRKMKKGLR